MTAFDYTGVMWAEATRDGDAEAQQELLLRGKLATAGFWPFLAAAQSEAEFGHRLALVEDRMAAVVPGPVLEPVLASVASDWKALNDSRQETARAAHVAAMQRAAVDRANRLDPVRAGQQFFDAESGRWVTVGSASPVSKDSVCEHSGTRVHQEGRDGRCVFCKRPLTEQTKQAYIDPSDAQRYNHYPDMNPPVDNGPLQGPDGFVTGGEGDAGRSDAVIQQRQLTPGQWTVTPGTEWPVRPNAADPTQVPRTAQSQGRVAGQWGYQGDWEDQEAATEQYQRGVADAHNHRRSGEDLRATPNWEDQNFHYKRGYELNREASRHQASEDDGWERSTSDDFNGSDKPWWKCEDCGSSNYSHGSTCNNCGAKGAKKASLHQAGQHQTAAERSDSWVDQGAAHSHGGADQASAAKRMVEIRSVHGDEAADDFMWGYKTSKPSTASRRQAGEGIAPTPGPNPNYFSQGSEGIAGPPTFPENPSSAIEPKTDNRMDDLYGAVPPQVSSGSAQGLVDGQGYSKQVPGSSATAGRLPFVSERAGAKEAAALPGDPAPTAHPDHQPIVPLWAGYPWCTCGFKQKGPKGKSLAEHLREFDPTYGQGKQAAGFDGGHVHRYVTWAQEQGHDPDEVSTLKKYEKEPGVGRAHVNHIADQLYIGGGDSDWRKQAATDGRIVGHCDNCNHPVRYHTNEGGADELRHLHNNHNRCSTGQKAASLRRSTAFFDPSDSSVRVVAAESATTHAVVDTAWGKYCTNGCGWGGCDSRESAAKKQGVQAQADGGELGKSLWEGVHQIMDPGSTEEGRKSDRNIHDTNDLLHAGYHPASIRHDESGTPYAETQHPSGWLVRDYGGHYLHVHHKATGDDEHDAIDVSHFDGERGERYRKPAFGPSDARHELDDFAREYGSQHENDSPQIKRWKQRESALQAQADGMSRTRPTLDNPSGAGDEYDANTWGNAVTQRPMQSAEDRGINTPTSPREPIGTVSSEPGRRADDDNRNQNGMARETALAGRSIEDLMEV